MTKTLKRVVPLILFIIIALFLWKGLKRNPHNVPSPLIGKPVPSFSAAALMHPKQKLTQKIFLGHVTLLNVFASWCSYCRSEQPLLMDIKNSKKVTLIGIDYKDIKTSVLQWLKESGNPYHTIIFDPKGNLSLNLGVYGTPETFIIDKNGIIRYKHVGPIRPAAWKDKLLPMIHRLENKKG